MERRNVADQEEPGEEPRSVSDPSDPSAALASWIFPAKDARPCASSRAACSRASSPRRVCFPPFCPAAPSSTHSISGSRVNSSSDPSSACLAGSRLSATSVASAAHLNGPYVSVGPNAATPAGVKRNGTTSGTCKQNTKSDKLPNTEIKKNSPAESTRGRRRRCSRCAPPRRS